jgi:fructan beta-fructosidase
MKLGLFLLAAVRFALIPTTSAIAQIDIYNEPYRPQVHFSPEHNWTNDPNGLVYYHGEYHLFFQYNPFGDSWGHMNWGHAVSSDLLHWRQLPVAIPEENGIMIFTGSVVIDQNDSSGLCKPASECLIAVYTGDSNTKDGHRQTQNLAYSLDDGRTWNKYLGNPILDLHVADFRDPDVSWDEARQRWAMAVSLPQEHKISFYHSQDLKYWTRDGDFGPAGAVGGVWECPTLLQVAFADKPGSIWVLKVGLNPGAPQGGSGEQYFLGNFDGTSFRASDKKGAHGWTNYGKDDYCAISFNGIPFGNPPVLLGWMDNWEYADKLPTSPWRGQMSLARKLRVIEDQDGLALAQEPIVSALRQVVALKHSSSTAGEQAIATLSAPYELDLKQPSPDANSFGIKIYSDDQHWTEVGFNLGTQEFYIDRTKSGEFSAAGFSARTVAHLAVGRRNDLKLIVDRSSLEAFVQGGTIVMTDLIYPTTSTHRIASFSSRPSHAGRHIKVWQLASIWVSARKP